MSQPENNEPNEFLPAVPATMDRRVTPRFVCDRGVQCWKEGSHVAYWGTFSDLGLTGCSVHLLPTPLPVGTHLTMVFALYGNNIRISGDVRMVHGAIMGIAFVALFVGIGVDFGIQFCVRYRAERHAEDDLRPALILAARGVGTPLALAAAIMSQELGKPVRFQMSRQDEFGYDNFGPAHLADIRAAVDANGKIVPPIFVDEA